MQYITQSINSYCLLNSYSTLPAFLWTEFIPSDEKEVKPWALTVADVLLWQTRVFTPFDTKAVAYKGRLKDKTFKEVWKIPDAIFLSLVTLPYLLLCRSKITVLAMPLLVGLKSIFLAKGFEVMRFSSIHTKGLSKAITLIVLGVFSIGPVVLISRLPKALNLNAYKTALGAFGYLATTFVTGALLKLHVYHNNREVRHAYHTYLTYKGKSI